MKVVIAGSRRFRDYEKMRKLVLAFLEQEDVKEVEVVSGCCRGADELGEKLAQEMGWKIARFPANWALYGKAAGHIRNGEMARYADVCLLFPVEGAENRGTRSMAREAVKAKCRGYIAR